MQIKNAERPIQPVPNGCTKPYILSCEDGNLYYTKFKENPENTRVLANEYICAELATLLNLPLSSPTLINVDTSFVDVYGEQINAHVGCATISPGLHFGTLKIKKTFQITNSKMLESAVNLNSIPDILLFDQLICNNDRDMNAGNLLFDASESKIVVVDHTHVFELGAIWDSAQLRMRIGQPFQPFVLNGYVFKKIAPFVRGNNPFHSIITKMSLVTDENLWHIIDNVPQEWNVTSEEKHALHEYLCDRLHRIEQALPILKPLLPHWKGGR